jgi:hypothetical protein
MVDQIEEHNMTTQFDETVPGNTAHQDAEVADALEQISEQELVALLRKHCEKSWQATRWLLEIKCPERYGKPKKPAPSGPDAAEVLSAVIDVVADEVADDVLRARIAARLDALTAGKPKDRPRRSSHPKVIKEDATPKAAHQAIEPHSFETPSDNQADRKRVCSAASVPPCAPSSDQPDPLLTAKCPASVGHSASAPVHKSAPPPIQSWIAHQQRKQDWKKRQLLLKVQQRRARITSQHRHLPGRGGT